MKNLFCRHSSCVTQEIDVGLIEAIPELLLLCIDSQGKQVPEGVGEVVELHSRHVEVKLGSPEHAVILAEGIAIATLPGLAHRVPEEVRGEVLALLSGSMDLRLEVEPRRDVEEKRPSTLSVIPGQGGGRDSVQCQRGGPHLKLFFLTSCSEASPQESSPWPRADPQQPSRRRWKLSPQDSWDSW